MNAPNLSPRPLRNADRDRSLFVDRDWELEVSRRVLQGGGNLLLLGDRGSGKTSFLRILEGELRQRGQDEVFVDGRAARSASELLGLIRTELGAWLHIPWGEVLSATASAVATIGQTGLPLMPQPGAAQLLIDEIRAMSRILEERRQRDVVVLLDEPSDDVGRLLFGRLRDELWSLQLAWAVAASSSSRGVFVEPPADAFWSGVVELGALPEPALRDLLRRRLGDYPLSESTASRLVENSSGNPRTLISLANELIVQQKSMDTIQGERDERLVRLSVLGEQARRLFEELDRGGPASPSDVKLQTKLGLSRPRLAQLMRELEHAGVVRSAQAHEPTGGRPRKVFEVI